MLLLSTARRIPTTVHIPSVIVPISTPIITASFATNQSTNTCSRSCGPSSSSSSSSSLVSSFFSVRSLHSTPSVYQRRDGNPGEDENTDSFRRRGNNDNRRGSENSGNRQQQRGGTGTGGGGQANASGAGGGRRERSGTRVGRPYLDPKSSRMLEVVRNDPNNQLWGGMIDIIEHAAYCDGQREEDADGFFFDNTRPEYDSDCDGDPFSNGYLTEDEYELTENYKPMPYIPGRIMDQIYYLHTIKSWSIGRLSEKYSLAPERVSAIINLKTTEPQMKAIGAYDEKLDQQLSDLYAGRFGSRRKTDIGSNNTDIGGPTVILPDNMDPDEALPKHPRAHQLGTLKLGNRLSVKPVPMKKERTHGSKFIFLDTSGRGKIGMGRNPSVTATWDGRVKFSTNEEVLYRSWTPRYWTLKKVSKGSTSNKPYADDDRDKGPATFRLTP